jgi:hypothetical protein
MPGPCGAVPGEGGGGVGWDCCAGVPCFSSYIRITSSTGTDGQVDNSPLRPSTTPEAPPNSAGGRRDPVTGSRSMGGGAAHTTQPSENSCMRTSRRCAAGASPFNQQSAVAKACSWVVTEGSFG